MGWPTPVTCDLKNSGDRASTFTVNLLKEVQRFLKRKETFEMLKVWL